MGFQEIADDIISFIGRFEKPLLIAIGAIGLIYIVYLLIKWLITFVPERRANARSHFFTAIIAYFIIFILIFALKKTYPVLYAWMKGEDVNWEDLKFDIKDPIDDAMDNLSESKDVLDEEGVTGAAEQAIDKLPLKDNVSGEEVMDYIDDQIDNGKENVNNAIDNLPETVGDIDADKIKDATKKIIEEVPVEDIKDNAGKVINDITDKD